MVYIITGQPGSGKTTLAKYIINNSKLDFIHLDGDIIREVINNKDYTKNGRIDHINNIYDMVKILHNQNKNIIISMVSPFKNLREDLKNYTKAVEIYLHSNRGIRKEFHVNYYEAPTNNFIKFNTDNLSVKEEFDQIPK